MTTSLLSNDDYEVLEDKIPPSVLEFDCVGNIVVQADGGDDRRATNTVAPITTFEIEDGEMKSSATGMLLKLISEKKPADWNWIT